VRFESRSNIGLAFIGSTAVLVATGAHLYLIRAAVENKSLALARFFTRR